MRAGDLKKLIDIEVKTRTPDGMGGGAVVWSTWASDLWASIWPVSSSEQIQANQDRLVVTHRIRIRFRELVGGDMRIKYGNKYFNIVSIINPNMGNRMIEFLAKEAA